MTVIFKHIRNTTILFPPLPKTLSIYNSPHTDTHYFTLLLSGHCSLLSQIPSRFLNFFHFIYTNILKFTCFWDLINTVKNSMSSFKPQFFLIFFVLFSLQTACRSMETFNITRPKHKWVGPSGNLTIHVDLHGSGDFKSVQAAVDSIPNNNQKNVLIKIAAGCYM